MALNDVKDFVIRYPGHPKYDPNRIIEDDEVEVIVQKLEMLLFTTKGEVLGNLDMGVNLEYYLWQTNVTTGNLKNLVQEQINTYIPELINMNYGLQIVFMQDPNNYQDMMFIYFKIADYEVYAQFGKSIT